MFLINYRLFLHQNLIWLPQSKRILAPAIDRAHFLVVLMGNSQPSHKRNGEKSTSSSSSGPNGSSGTNPVNGKPKVLPADILTDEEIEIIKVIIIKY